MQGTALQIARQAAIELGLSPPSELVTSQEQTSIQLLGLLNSAGNELLNYFDWELLLSTHYITSVANQGSYPAPADYSRMVNQTIWDHDNRRPAMGPVSSQGWAILQNAVVITGPFVRYRVYQGNVDFLPVPTEAGHEFNYQYISNGWVNSYLDPNAYSAFVLNDQDTIRFDFWLMVKFLKMKMWQAKGLDTTSLQADFTRTFDAITGYDHGAPVLGLANSYKVPYLGIGNVPDGNWNTGP